MLPPPKRLLMLSTLSLAQAALLQQYCLLQYLLPGSLSTPWSRQQAATLRQDCASALKSKKHSYCHWPISECSNMTRNMLALRANHATQLINTKNTPTSIRFVIRTRQQSQGECWQRQNKVTHVFEELTSLLYKAEVQDQEHSLEVPVHHQR